MADLITVGLIAYAFLVLFAIAAFVVGGRSDE